MCSRCHVSDSGGEATPVHLTGEGVVLASGGGATWCQRGELESTSTVSRADFDSTAQLAGVWPIRLASIVLFNTSLILVPISMAWLI